MFNTNEITKYLVNTTKPMVEVAIVTMDPALPRTVEFSIRATAKLVVKQTLNIGFNDINDIIEDDAARTQTISLDEIVINESEIETTEMKPASQSIYWQDNYEFNQDHLDMILSSIENFEIESKANESAYCSLTCMSLNETSN